MLADNLKSNPGIKWQYFSSEEGIFTVFPAHKFHCKGSYEHRSRYSSTAPLIFIFSQSVVLKTLVKPSVVYTTVTYSLTSSWCSPLTTSSSHIPSHRLVSVAVGGPRGAHWWHAALTYHDTPGLWQQCGFLTVFFFYQACFKDVCFGFVSDFFFSIFLSVTPVCI